MYETQFLKTNMLIIQDDLNGPEIKELLEIHFEGMKSHSPAGACHFLDIEGLKLPNVTFWSVWENAFVAGCGALKEHDPQLGEIKSMRTHPNFLRRGVAKLILEHIIATAQNRGYHRLNLETGTGDVFVPAHKLYESKGFVVCPEFGGYTENSFSRFYALDLH